MLTDNACPTLTGPSHCCVPRAWQMNQSLGLSKRQRGTPLLRMLRHANSLVYTEDLAGETQSPERS